MKTEDKMTIFAPMEGITDAVYRNTILELYPKWDILFTDFIRSPRDGFFNNEKIITHIGREIIEDKSKLKKTVVQILTSKQSRYIDTVKALNSLGISWIDLNIGCPVKRVVAHGGGAYLLSNQDELEEIVNNIRKYFDGTFSVKMRIGMDDDQNFFKILKILENSSVDLVTIHGRKRSDFYTGVADWNYIKQAKESTSIKIIGNGDIKDVEEIQKRYLESNCDGVMIGRAAVSRPWMLENKVGSNSQVLFLKHLANEYKNKNIKDEFILGRMKCIAHYMTKEKSILRVRSLVDFFSKLELIFQF